MRDTAFKRGTAYLERYCLLIAFTSFLERTKGSDITFQASQSSLLHSAFQQQLLTYQEHSAYPRAMTICQVQGHSQLAGCRIVSSFQSGFIPSEYSQRLLGYLHAV